MTVAEIAEVLQKQVELTHQGIDRLDYPDLIRIGDLLKKLLSHKKYEEEK